MHRAGDIAWAIVLRKQHKRENSTFYQSEENGISYMKKMANNFLKTTHSLRVAHETLPSYLLEYLTLTSRGNEWSFKNHESGKIFAEFRDVTVLCF